MHRFDAFVLSLVAACNQLFGTEVREFLRSHPRCFVVEQNRDAQLRNLLAMETETDFHRLSPVLYYGGMPMSRHHVVQGILEQLEEAPA